MADAAVNPASRQQRTKVVDVDSYEMVKRIKAYKPPKDLPVPHRQDRPCRAALPRPSSARCASIRRCWASRSRTFIPTTWCRAAWCSCAVPSDHHGVGSRRQDAGRVQHLFSSITWPSRWRRSTRCCARAPISSASASPLDFEGRRRAGSLQIAVEFCDPDGHRLEIFWGLDVVGSDDPGFARKRNGNGRIRSRTRSPIR